MSDSPASLLVLNALPIQSGQPDIVSQVNQTAPEFEQIIGREQQVQSARGLPAVTVVASTPLNTAIQAIVLEEVSSASPSSEAVLEAPLKPELGREILSQTSETVTLPQTPAAAVQQLAALSAAVHEITVQLSKKPSPVSHPLPLDGKSLPEARPTVAPAQPVGNPTQQLETEIAQPATTPEPLSKPTGPRQLFPMDTITLDPEPRTQVQQTLPTAQPSGGEVRSPLEVQQWVSPAPTENRVPIQAMRTPLLTQAPGQDQQAWQSELSQRIVWMTENQTPVAKLRLNPPELGLVEIRVSVNQEQASVSFVASSLDVRTAIESAMPRLQGLLSDSGLNLGHADVEHRQAKSDSQSQEHFSPPDHDPTEPHALTDAQSIPDDNRLLDIFI